MSIQWTLVFLCTCAAAFAAEEQAKPEIPTIPAPVTKLALFKNGIGAVIRKANPTPTPFLVKDSMTPIHGTLWFMPSDGLSVRTVKQRVREPNTQPFQNLTASYEGRAVQLTLSGNSETPSEIIGKVIRPVKETPQKQRDAGYNSFQPSTERFLTLSLNSGEIISIDTSRIISIRALKINQTLEMEKEALLITPKVKSAGSLAICYLTKGAAWAPSYRLELGKDSAMRLSMSTVIMNELEDLKDVEMNLISGYPNIKFENAASPMASGMTMAEFFRQLTGSGGTASPILAQRVMSNKAFASDAAMGAAVTGATLPPSGESEDIHYRNIGKISLKKGERLYLPLESAESTYERIVEWTINDRRDNWGRPVNFGSMEKYNGELWDAVSFRNPFKSPITTAPIEITDGGKFLGQTTVEWVNPGQKNILRITKAMTVTGQVTENEIAKTSLKEEKASSSPAKSATRETVRIGGDNYWKQEIEGVLALKNYRKTNAKAVIKLQFSGDLVSAEGNPSKQLVPQGYNSVNPRNELTWETVVKADRELKIHYRYSVLVRY